MFHNTLWLIKYQKARKNKQNSKTPGDLDRCPTRGVGRTPTMFHNTLVVSSSPTGSTTQSRETGEIQIRLQPTSRQPWEAVKEMASMAGRAHGHARRVFRDMNSRR